MLFFIIVIFLPNRLFCLDACVFVSRAFRLAFERFGVGYPEKRTVTILGDESFYTSQPEPFRVLFIDSPLEGLAKVSRNSHLRDFLVA
jgi:hypothetical protein